MTNLLIGKLWPRLVGAASASAAAYGMTNDKRTALGAFVVALVYGAAHSATDAATSAVRDR